MSVSSAVKSGSTVTVSGSGFGTKSTAAPFFFQPFTGFSGGETPTAAGFDSWINRGGEAVYMADGVGGGSLRCDPVAASNAFPHIGKYLPASVSELLVAFYFKLYGSPASSNQMKFCRAGTPGGDPHLDYASTDAKIFPSIWVYSGPQIGGNSVQAQWFQSGGAIQSYYTDESGGGSSGIPLGSQPSVDAGQWVFAEVRYRYNDVGSANGLLRIDLNGFRWHERPAIQPRTSAGQYMGFIQPIPSIDEALFDYAISRVYIDTGSQSVAQVFLSDSSTASGVTKKFLLPASAWSDSSITVGNAASIPSGYDYLYVVNPSGQINSAGRVLS